MTQRRIRVLLCDDSRSLATLVRDWLEEYDDVEFAGAVHERPEAVEAVAREQPDVVLLDTMGDPYDSSVLEGIRAAVPGVRVIVYSGYVDMVGPAGLPLRPDAFLDKGADAAALVSAIRSVARGG
jgi:DNA-binding NarL/FixJ family response regulator